MKDASVIVFSDAKIMTMDEAMPQVEAVCVVGERIVAAGGREDMLDLASMVGHVTEKNWE